LSRGESLQSGATNPIIVEWLMGYDIGIAKYYVAANIKQEYSELEQAVRLYDNKI